MRPGRTLAQWFALANGGLLVVGLAGVIAGFLALADLKDARTLVVDRLQPAIATALRLDIALVNQETGVRGYVQTGDPTFLEPFQRGIADEATGRAVLSRLSRRVDPALAARVQDAAEAAARWREGFARPAVTAAMDRREVPVADQRRGKALFDAQRAASDRLQADLEVRRGRTRERLSDTAKRVGTIFGVFGGLLLLSLLLAAATLRNQVIQPLRDLTARVRRVAAGDYAAEVTGCGAREVTQLAADVDDMRRQIVAERDELARSNAELEQFAYVASHDLQEPLRKVASFTQMLQRRYGGELDERADTYIEFAVDGAKRMQELINDLLAFSRVGRLTEDQTVFGSRDLVERAIVALSEHIEAEGARVEIGADLPPVRGEVSLLALVFQNLISNGLKFRGEQPPVVRVTCEPHEDGWRFTVADNGIGIEAEYADRIFVIFQRLHTRDAYGGTGIGLAMCRKVVEYHGGQIWLDTGVAPGATFHFTLPAIQETP